VIKGVLDDKQQMASSLNERLRILLDAKKNAPPPLPSPLKDPEYLHVSKKISKVRATKRFLIHQLCHNRNVPPELARVIVRFAQPPRVYRVEENLYVCSGPSQLCDVIRTIDKHAVVQETELVVNNEGIFVKDLWGGWMMCCPRRGFGKKEWKTNLMRRIPDVKLERQVITFIAERDAAAQARIKAHKRAVERTNQLREEKILHPERFRHPGKQITKSHDRSDYDSVELRHLDDGMFGRTWTEWTCCNTVVGSCGCVRVG